MPHTDYDGEESGWTESKLRYAGKDPNNYVTFNGELWRIIGLVNVMTTSNQVEQRLKIIRSSIYTGASGSPFQLSF